MTRPPFKLSLTWRLLASALILLLINAVRQEISASLAIPQNWEVLFSALPLTTILVAGSLTLLGLAALVIQAWAPEMANRISAWFKRKPLLRWSSLLGLALFSIWFLLFSAWQVVFTGAWTQFLYLMMIASLFAVTSGDQDITLGWKEAALAVIWLVYAGMVQEARQLTPLAVVYRGLTIFGGMVGIVTALRLYHPLRLPGWWKRLIAWRDRSGLLRWFLSLLVACSPVVLMYSLGRMDFGTHPYIRFSVLLLALPILAWLVSRKQEGAALEDWLSAAGILLFANVISYRLTAVTGFPFSMSWSEGNRFYDYSLTFASNIYNYPGKLEVPYFSPGRYALWGSLFLIPDLPIWAHRLWNVFLLTIPALVVGGLLARPVRRSPYFLPILLWMTLYLLQGPILPPLLVSIMLFLPFVFVKNPWVRAGSLIATSLAAGLSRWTWAVGPGTWGALVDLFLYYPQRKGSFFRRILPTVALALLGVLPGILATWGEVWSRSGDFAASQPLLWYRLWANASNTIGILPGILRASGPLVILLVWLAATRRIKLDWVQAAAAGGSLLAFLVAGIVMSMKIGGGGDLHNLDLYLLTTALLAGLAAYLLHKQGKLIFSGWPRWIQAVLVLCLFFPGWSASRVGEPFEVPDNASIVKPSLATMRAVVSDFSKQGEILFMDQRQLLTFGFVEQVPFTPDYEKKYLMDQAMGGNAAFFQKYYQDLADRRFVLIITEPLNVHRAGAERYFGEENDAWVKWVSAPTLCFYRNRMLLRDAGIMLLVPRENTEACARYLEP